MSFGGGFGVSHTTMITDVSETEHVDQWQMCFRALTAACSVVKLLDDDNDIVPSIFLFGYLISYVWQIWLCKWSLIT